MKPFFVFDVESVGLHGDAFAVAGGIYDIECKALHEFCFSVNRDTVNGADSDRKWVNENVPVLGITHYSAFDLREVFWKEAMEAKARPGGVFFAAECAFPVEARFVAKCIDDDPEGRRWAWPFPFHEIGSLLLAANIDPVAHYERLPGESPAHNPLCDVRQSARLLMQAMKRLTNATL